MTFIIESTWMIPLAVLKAVFIITESSPRRECTAGCLPEVERSTENIRDEKGSRGERIACVVVIDQF